MPFRIEVPDYTLLGDMGKVGIGPGGTCPDSALNLFVPRNRDSVS